MQRTLDRFKFCCKKSKISAFSDEELVVGGLKSRGWILSVKILADYLARFARSLVRRKWLRHFLTDPKQVLDGLEHHDQSIQRFQVLRTCPPPPGVPVKYKFNCCNCTRPSLGLVGQTEDNFWAVLGPPDALKSGFRRFSWNNSKLTSWPRALQRTLDRFEFCFKKSK